MKTLLLLALLFPQFCQSQYPERQTQPDAYFLWQDSGEVFVPNGNLLRDLLKYPNTLGILDPGTPIVSEDYYRAFLTRLLSDWQEYRDSCWADSTLHEWWGPEMHEVGGMIISYGHFRHEKWAHRDPTLPGFMDFLKKRIGGGK